MNISEREILSDKKAFRSAFINFLQKTCSCKSTNCEGSFDCDALLMGSACTCSPCTGENGTCEETSTASSIAVVKDFFDGHL